MTGHLNRDRTCPQCHGTGPTEELAPALVVSGASVIPFPKEHRP